MKPLHCIKCASTRIDNGTSRIFTALGVLVLTAGFIAAIVSLNIYPAGDYGLISRETMVAGLVIAFGFMLINQGTQRSERVRCRSCGTEFTPPKPIITLEKTR